LAKIGAVDFEMIGDVTGIVKNKDKTMGVNATGTLGGRRSSAEDARIEEP